MKNKFNKEKITAQNSTINQSEVKYFDTFTKEDVARLVYRRDDYLRETGTKDTYGDFGMTHEFALGLLKNADKKLSSARMSEEDKSFIKGAIGLLITLAKYSDPKEIVEYIDELGYVAENAYPEDLNDIEDPEERVEIFEEEVSNLLYEVRTTIEKYADNPFISLKSYLNEMYEIYRSYMEQTTEWEVLPNEHFCKFVAAEEAELFSSLLA